MVSKHSRKSIIYALYLRNSPDVTSETAAVSVRLNTTISTDKRFRYAKFTKYSSVGVLVFFLSAYFIAVLSVTLLSLDWRKIGLCNR